MTDHHLPRHSHTWRQRRTGSAHIGKNPVRYTHSRIRKRPGSSPKALRSPCTRLSTVVYLGYRENSVRYDCMADQLACRRVQFFFNRVGTTRLATHSRSRALDFIVLLEASSCFSATDSDVQTFVAKNSLQSRIQTWADCLQPLMQLFCQ